MKRHVVTLECDRCAATAETPTPGGPTGMEGWYKLEHPHLNGTDRFDLCPGCAIRFLQFMDF